MSFILDALRKAERDRSLGQAPRMEEVALAPESVPESPAASRSGTLFGTRAAIIGVLTIVITLGLYLLLFHAPTPTSAATSAPQGVVTATVRGPAPVKTATPAASTARTEPADSGPPAIADNGSLSTLDDLDGAQSDDAAQAPDTAEPAESPAAASPPRTDFIARPAPPAPVSAAPTPQKKAAPATAEATPLEAMPPAYRAEFPPLTVEVHAWDSDPTRRFVLINGRRYREGDALAAGPVLVQIAQEGLVLEYRGSQVRYSLLLQQ